MKKTVTVIALLVAIGFFSNSASALWGNGHGNGFGPGSCRNSDQNSTVNAETRHAFFEETHELRNELRSIRAEYFALMNSEDTDKDTARVLWNEMFDLQQQLQQKATEAGLLSPQTGCGSKYANARGRGCTSLVDCTGAANGCNCNAQDCPNDNTAAPTE